MIVKLLRGLFSGGPYYLRISRHMVSVRDVATGAFVDLAPKLGLDEADTILSVGDPVDSSAARVLQPFDHPRVLINDYAGGEKVVQYAIRKLAGMSFISPSPIVIVHPDIELDGGLTQIEARALREMVEGAGARKVYLHYGRQLTDQEVASLKFADFEALL